MAADAPMNDVPSDELEAEYGFEDKVGVDKDLSGDGGVIKTIIKKGDGWETPEKGDDVTVHYTGTLLDGTKFDSSKDRDQPFNFKLGQGSVIKGWDVGVAAMKKGEVARLTLKPDYAYGAAGSSPNIPPESTLLFEVELISWKSVKDITGDGGVIKTILSEGSGWQHPNPQDEVVITYTATLTDPPSAAAGAAAGAASAAAPAAAAAEQDASTPVVASSPEGGAVFIASEAPCSGLAAAVKTMKREEAVRLLLKPGYAVGLADVPEGKLLQVDATLTALHPITTVFAGLTRKTLLKPEGSYMHPNEGSSVSLSVEVRGEDGAVLEARHEVDFVLDEEQSPEALELCLTQMVEGEHALISVTDPSLLAAPEGAVVGGAVPLGTASAVFDVTLTSFKKAKEKWEMNNAEKLAAAQSRKEKGNAAYKAGRISRAVRQYTAAYETANSISETDMAPHPVMDAPSSSGAEGGEAAAPSLSKAQIMAQAKDVKKASCLNLAAAALKQQEWGEAVKQATRVLELDPDNVKARYRRAQACMGLSELVEAEVDIKAGLLSHPDNTDLAALYRKLKVLLRESNKKEAKLYGKMFAALGRPNNSDQGPTPAAAVAADAPSAAAVGAGDEAAPMQEDTPAAAGAAPVVEAAA